MDNTNKTVIVSALNDLVKINRDRFVGYQKAMELTKNMELRTIFERLSLDSSQNINELSDQILRIHGKPFESTSIAGKFYRTWMDIKSVFSGGSDHSILKDCDYGESVALEAYERVNESNDFIMDVSADILIRYQQQRIMEGHDTIKQLLHKNVHQ
ncbi:hypothetical protein D3C87_1583180 [compost metagenome]|uniref:DUF2383 domain-containing protein n=1 Tax=Solitalea canadensis (strain ATCC 29591 / DSM 3403 / JCM 21819 / LMG 8368 / NBRC 15130 / NCIMB 12057 / USAM 9D) TaxID=929556 RepID=H8KQK5_SOLCM|nr:PA2169 family four-helix-bundle protein [Solitalea canadensis]AFD06743.1 hypothetical protein Solca_1677 [Solitalea canadensis DSM 3403]